MYQCLYDLLSRVSAYRRGINSVPRTKDRIARAEIEEGAAFSSFMVKDPAYSVGYRAVKIIRM